jgi:3'(2'), 5'-bisphosphate nucleotidase
MMSLDHARLADQLLAAVLRAGAAIMRHRRAGVAVQHKTDKSPVTLADQEAEDIILSALAACAPGVPVVAEEASSRGEKSPLADTFFLVDPLDGTRDFVKGGDDFTVNIGLITGGIPRFGMIYAPALDELTMTLGNDHAAEVRISPDATPAGLSSLPLTPMRTRTPDTRQLVAVGSRSHRSPKDEAFKTNPRITAYREIGSSLKFGLVARGEADIYPRFGATSEWDTAAGHAILLAAGGEVTQLDGAPFLYGKHDAGFLNPSFVAWGDRSLIPLFTPELGA